MEKGEVRIVADGRMNRRTSGRLQSSDYCTDQKKDADWKLKVAYFRSNFYTYIHIYFILKSSLVSVPQALGAIFFAVFLAFWLRSFHVPSDSVDMGGPAAAAAFLPYIVVIGGSYVGESGYC